MAKIRVYELARKYDISSEALIKILIKEGITVKSHMSTVEERVEKLIEQHIDRVKADTKKREKKKKTKKGKPAQAEKEKKKKKKKRSPRKKVEKKEVKESVKRTLAKLEATKKPKKRRRKKKSGEEKADSENVIKLPEYSTVSELARHLGADPTEVIGHCMEMGLMVTVNQRLDADTIVMIADEYGYQVDFTKKYGQELLKQERKVKPERMVQRPPVVTIMGHVDHGKTSLLDKIRESNIIAGEKGGITQHIGAYEVQMNDSQISFIDTPGHEAFTAMRSRGAHVTDIVILIVAADDGVMPQTEEAINHARAADVPIIIAINKIDLPNADVEKVKRELLQHNLVLEEYGGNIMGAQISARTGDGIDDLLEMILLQAEMMEIKADPEAEVRGVVLEARKDEGVGIVSTVLVQQGTLEIGDIFVVGNYSGRVKALMDERGRRVKSCLPGRPIIVLGCNGVPQAGDQFIEIEDESAARDIARKRQQFQRERDREVGGQRITLDELYQQIQEGEVKELNIIIRADTHGSAEALMDSLASLQTEEVKVNILQKAVGLINESDILLASASNAVVIGFHVNAAPPALELARSEGVDVRFYDVIYQAIEEVKAAMSGLLEPVTVEKELGVAEVRQLFQVSRFGTIAGCYVKSGMVRRNANVRVKREEEVIHQGMVNSLKRFKEDVREVQAGYECGVGITEFNDFQEGDLLEFYTEEKESRTLE